MRQQFLLFGLLATLLIGCNGEELAQLQTENEQLKAALGESNSFAEDMNNKLGQIDVLLDSIESGEGALALTLSEGTSYENYTDRLRSVKDHISNSKKEVEKLEAALAKSNSNNKVFTAQIERLKKTIEERETSIIQLSEQVEKYKNENQSLIKKVDLQEQEILAREAKINEKKKEVSFLEEKLEQLIKQATEAEANSYYAQGDMQEQLAKKTKLAPKKKKEYLQAAYDFYKKAFEKNAHKEAYTRMQAIEPEL